MEVRHHALGSEGIPWEESTDTVLKRLVICLVHTYKWGQGFPASYLSHHVWFQLPEAAGSLLEFMLVTVSYFHGSLMVSRDNNIYF